MKLDLAIGASSQASTITAPSDVSFLLRFRNGLTSRDAICMFSHPARPPSAPGDRHRYRHPSTPRKAAAFACALSDAEIRAILVQFKSTRPARERNQQQRVSQAKSVVVANKGTA